MVEQNQMRRDTMLVVFFVVRLFNYRFVSSACSAEYFKEHIGCNNSVE